MRPGCGTYLWRVCKLRPARCHEGRAEGLAIALLEGRMCHRFSPDFHYFMNEPAFCSEFQPAKALTCSQFLSFFSSILGRQTYQSPIICNTALIIWRNHEKPFCRQQTHADSQIQSIFVMRSCDEVHKTSGELFLRSPRTRKAHNRTFQPSA